MPHVRRRALPPRLLVSKPRAGNQFQLDIGFLRGAMEYQRGVAVRLSYEAINGWWESGGGATHFGARLTGPMYRGKFVANAVCDDGASISLTASVLLRVDTEVAWRPVPFLLPPADRHGANSRARALAFADECAKRALPPGSTVLTFDGNGDNLTTIPTRLPNKVLVCEMDPVVALAEQLAFGKDKVLFTGADARFAAPSTKLEHLLLRDSKLLRGVRVGAVYFDYCGGPAGDLRNVVDKLPDAEVVGVTIAKRQHPGLLARFADYSPTPRGFRVARVFDHPKVVCTIYVRSRRRGTAAA